jgi:hypothetical protein
MADGSGLPTRRFSAFISYSSDDAAFARRLHRRLESYRLPRRLTSTVAGAEQPTRLKPLFRDVDELTASHDLSESVRAALAQSDHLIVVCSPRSARSDWVGREIEYFRSLHGDSGVLAALIDGEPADAFPPALLRSARGGEIEPLAADFRKDSGFRRLAMLKLVAALAGVPLDQLVQRDGRRQIRRLAVLAGVALAGLAAMAFLALSAVAAQQATAAERNRAEALIGYMLTDLRPRLKQVGRLDLLASTNGAVLDYFSEQDLSRLDSDALRQRAQLLQAMGEDAEVRGDIPGARVQFREARRSTAALLADQPEDPERIFAHAQSEYWVGFIAWRAGQPAEARRAFEAYAALARRLVAKNPGKPEWRQEVGYAENNLGMLAMRQRGDMAAARDHFAASLRIKHDLARGEPDDVELQRDIANGYAWLADAERLLSDFSSAEASRRRQRQVLQALADRDPANFTVQADLLGADLAFARIDAARRRYGDAIRRLDVASRRADRLVRQAPDNRSIRRQARAIELFRARYQLDLEQPGPALADIRGCDETHNAGDRELTVWCEILLDRATGARRPLASLLPADFPRDLYTARWGLNLAEEFGR